MESVFRFGRMPCGKSLARCSLFSGTASPPNGLPLLQHNPDNKWNGTYRARSGRTDGYELRKGDEQQLNAFTRTQWQKYVDAMSTPCPYKLVASRSHRTTASYFANMFHSILCSRERGGSRGVR